MSPGKLEPKGQDHNERSKKADSSNMDGTKSSKVFGSKSGATSELEIAQSMFSSEDSALSIDQDYSPLAGFDIYWDYVSHMFEDFENARIVFVVQTVSLQVLDPVLVEARYATLDPTDSKMKYIGVNKSNLLKGI